LNGPTDARPRPAPTTVPLEGLRLVSQLHLF